MPENPTSDFSRPPSYAAASKWLHWIIALCVLATLPMGILMIRVPEGALQNRLFDLHRSTGILVLALAVLRVSARYAFGTPAPTPSLTRFERIASTAAHHSPPIHFLRVVINVIHNVSLKLPASSITSTLIQPKKEGPRGFAYIVTRKVASWGLPKSTPNLVEPDFAVRADKEGWPAARFLAALAEHSWMRQYGPLIQIVAPHLTPTAVSTTLADNG